MNFSKVEGHSSLVRDESTKAIINTNTTEYKNYLMMRQSKLNESQKIENLREEIDCVKNDLCEIKKLLQKMSGEL